MIPPCRFSFIIAFAVFANGYRNWIEPSYSQKNEASIEYLVQGPIVYMLFPKPKSWDAAQIDCAYYNASLFKLPEDALAQELLNFTQESNYEIREVWTGGYQNGNNWYWSIDETMVEQNLSENDFHCLALQRGKNSMSTLVSKDCLAQNAFICETTHSSDLTLPSQSVYVPNTKVRLFHHKLTWYEAANYCNRQQLRLATISSLKLAKIIRNTMIISRPSFERIWIGGFYSHNKWKWLSSGDEVLTNSENGYPPWFSTPKKAGCLLMDRHLNHSPTFVPTRCTQKCGFACETYNEITDHSPRTFEIKNQNYTIYRTRLSFDNAVKYCEKYQKVIPEIGSDEEVKMIVKALLELPEEIQHVWLGGRKKHKTFHWNFGKEPTNTSKPDTNWHFIGINDEEVNLCLNLDLDLISTYGVNCALEQYFVCVPDKTKQNKMESKPYLEQTGRKSLPFENSYFDLSFSEDDGCIGAGKIRELKVKGVSYTLSSTKSTWKEANATCAEYGGYIANVAEKLLRKQIFYKLRTNNCCFPVFLEFWIQMGSEQNLVLYSNRRVYVSRTKTHTENFSVLCQKL